MWTDREVGQTEGLGQTGGWGQTPSYSPANYQEPASDQQISIDTLPEKFRRRPAKTMGSPRMGSNSQVSLPVGWLVGRLVRWLVCCLVPG
jgi:hypothetical protein